MLTDERIVAIVGAKIARSTGFIDSPMPRERERVQRYYSGDLPAPMTPSSSKYVSDDVYDSVQGLHSQLLETFTGTLEPVQFKPVGPEDVAGARIATAVANFVMDEQNDGFQIKSDLLHDGLVARMGVAKVWWTKSESESEETFEDPTEDELAAHFDKNPTADPTDIRLNPDGEIAKVVMSTKVDTSQVKVEVIPPEEFGVSSGARSIHQADLVYHRTTMSRSRLVSMGVKQSLVDELSVGRDWVDDIEHLARVDGAEYSGALREDDEQRAGDKIEVFECYTKMDMRDGTGGSKRKLWKITLASGKVLFKERVKRIPFFAFVPIPRPHTVWGDNFAARVIPTQNTRTTLVRGVVDHMVITNNPRWMVARNGLAKPDELTENKIGGIVNVSRLDALAPLPVANLNPYVFQTVGLLDADKEKKTGISQLSQGLSKEALSKQNSDGMVERLVGLSQVRQKVIARRFAEFLKGLYREIYTLVVENAGPEFTVSVAGNYVQVDPSTLQQRKDLSIDFSLGYGEKEREGEKYLKVDQYLAGDPRIAPVYDASRRYNVLTKVLKSIGIKDVDSIIADPAKIKPPEPDPKGVADLEKLKAETAMMNAQAQATLAKAQREEALEQLQHELKIEEMRLKVFKTRNDAELERDKFEHKAATDAAELRMAQDTAAAGAMTGQVRVVT